MTDEDDHRPRRGDLSALWERVDSHGAAIRSLTVEVSDQFRDLRAETSQQLGALATNLTEQVKGNAGAIERIASKMDSNAVMVAERSRPQYLALFAGIISAIGVSVTVIQWQESQRDKPVDEKLTALTTAIGDLTKNTAASFGEAARNTVSQTQFQTAAEFRDKLQSAIASGRDKELAELTARVDRIENRVVPRAEFEVRWASEAERDSRMQNEIDEARRQADTREHELELRYFNAKPVQ